MSRLTENDEQGNWCLKGVAWDDLHVGSTLTKETSDRLYGALWKLMEYECTGLSPEQADNLAEGVETGGDTNGNDKGISGSIQKQKGGDQGAAV